MSINVVTGGSGFIGQHLVAQLLARGETVRIVDLEAPPAKQAGVTFFEGSITDQVVLRAAMEGAHFVYHTAAIPHLWAPDPTIYQKVNVEGSRAVFEAALSVGVTKIIHTSSSSVLLDRKTGSGSIVLDETHRTSEQDLFGHYAKSKWRAEAVAETYADRLAIVVVMPTLPLGPGDRHMTPPTQMLQDFIKGKTPAYIDCLLNIVDVRDVAAGHILACERGQPGQRYLLNQHTIAMMTFLRHLETLTGRGMPHWRLPQTLALLASAADEAWSTHVSHRAPLAPLAGTRMAVRPVRFCNHLAKTVLGLPKTPLLRTLTDAVAWLTEGDQVTANDEKLPLVFSGR